MVCKDLGDEMESARDLLLKRPGAVLPLGGPSPILKTLVSDIVSRLEAITAFRAIGKGQEERYLM